MNIFMFRACYVGFVLI